VARKIIFLDRDGVINKEVEYLHKIEDFVFIDGVFASLKYLKSLDYEFIIVTNQSGIGRGWYLEADYEILMSWMFKEFNKHGLTFLDSFYCPHQPDANCDCRKPKPGLLMQAIEKYEISKERSWMIGDSERDIRAANYAGIFNTVIVESGHPVNKKETSANYLIDSIKNIDQIIFD